MGMKRRKVKNKSRDRKKYSNTAERVHPKNTSSNHARGGIRL